MNGLTEDEAFARLEVLGQQAHNTPPEAATERKGRKSQSEVDSMFDRVSEGE